MEKVKSLPPADSHFQIFAKVKFQILAFFLEFSASIARLLDSFSMSEENKDKLQLIAMDGGGFESNLENKYENWKFDQKSENLKSDKIWIFQSNAFHGPPKFTKASD